MSTRYAFGQYGSAVIRVVRLTTRSYGGGHDSRLMTVCAGVFCVASVCNG